MVFRTDQVRVSSKFRRFLRGCDWTLRADTAFVAVMRACAAPRPKQPTTWITSEMHDAYCRLHALGYAHSCEVYAGDDLVGGIYGVAVGRMFFGESMFSARTNGSKAALIALCRSLDEWQFPLLDAQVHSEHLVSLGAIEISRAEFAHSVNRLAAQTGVEGSWRNLLPTTDARALA
jgi:leucyl/phenylalanyl-tRNA--protein transferase